MLSPSLSSAPGLSWMYKVLQVCLCLTEGGVELHPHRVERQTADWMKCAAGTVISKWLCGDVAMFICALECNSYEIISNKNVLFLWFTALSLLMLLFLLIQGREVKMHQASFVFNFVNFAFCIIQTTLKGFEEYPRETLQGEGHGNDRSSQASTTIRELWS